MSDSNPFTAIWPVSLIPAAVWSVTSTAAESVVSAPPATTTAPARVATDISVPLTPAASIANAEP